MPELPPRRAYATARGDFPGLYGRNEKTGVEGAVSSKVPYSFGRRFLDLFNWPAIVEVIHHRITRYSVCLLPACRHLP